MAIVEGIENPEDYIEALIAVSNMVRDDTGSCRNILRLVSRSIEAIPSPYERGTALLNVIPIAEVCGEHSYVDVFLGEVDRAMEQINIPFIVAVLKRALVQRLIAIAQRRETRTVHGEGDRGRPGDRGRGRPVRDPLSAQSGPAADRDRRHPRGRAGCEAEDPFGRVLEEPDRLDRPEPPRRP